MASWKAKHKRRSASKRQGGRCFWCDCAMLTHEEAARLPDGHRRQHSRQETAEHLVPLSLGGTDDSRNVVAACQLCNSVRADTSLESWLPRVKLRLTNQGIPSFFEVILSRLEKLGIALPIGGQPGNGPATLEADSPPRKDS